MNIIATIVKHGDNDYELDWVDMDEKKSIQIMTFIEDYVPGSLRGDIDSIIKEISESFRGWS